jgi:hypothetical protein
MFMFKLYLEIRDEHGHASTAKDYMSTFAQPIISTPIILKVTWLYLRANGGLLSVPKRFTIPLLPRVEITLTVGDK